MARIQYAPLMPEWSGILDVFSRKPEDLAISSATSASYTDPMTGYQLVFEGTGFKYQGEKIKSGELDTLRFTDGEGNDFLTVTNIDADLKELTTALTMKGLGTALKLLFDGNDTWTGTDHNDYIFGDKGNDKLVGGLGDDDLSGGSGKDRMTGDEGSDWFQLWRGVDKDVVTDFHADGGDGVQDYVILFTHDYKIRGDDTHTIVDIGKGDQLVLRGVDKADFNTDDIQFF
jgi:Ca2+-binding RTX toxin-like protein